MEWMKECVEKWKGNGEWNDEWKKNNESGVWKWFVEYGKEREMMITP